MVAKATAIEVTIQPFGMAGMLFLVLRETISDRDYKEVFEAPLTQVQIDRKLKEWGMMYDCLQNISLYEYPVEEAKALLKQIKIS